MSSRVAFLVAAGIPVPHLLLSWSSQKSGVCLLSSLNATTGVRVEHVVKLGSIARITTSWNLLAFAGNTAGH